MNEREELLRCITEICRSHPDMRLGQLLCNLASLGRGDSFGDVWEAEDRDLLEPAKQLAASLRDAANQSKPLEPQPASSFHAHLCRMT